MNFMQIREQTESTETFNTGHSFLSDNALCLDEVLTTVEMPEPRVLQRSILVYVCPVILTVRLYNDGKAEQKP